MSEFLTISTISKLSGVNAETIRYYEKVGVLPLPKRAKNGYRIYDDHILIHIKFIKNCRKLGFSIEEIKQLDALRKSPSADCHQADTIIVENLRKIREKIIQLKIIERFLTAICDCDSDSIRQCKVMIMLDTHRGGHEHDYE